MFFKELYKSKRRKETGLILLEGLKNIQLAQNSQFPILHSFSTEESPDFQRVSKGTMKSITGNHFVTHIAISKAPAYKENNEPTILLDNIFDYGNIGSILRTAYAFNIKNIIYLSEVDFWHHKTIEASRGTVFQMNATNCENIEQCKFLLKNKTKIATVLSGDNLQEIKKPNNFCLMLGNETHGLREELIDIADIKCTIPTNFESLNVAVASGIILYNFSLYK